MLDLRADPDSDSLHRPAPATALGLNRSHRVSRLRSSLSPFTGDIVWMQSSESLDHGTRIMRSSIRVGLEMGPGPGPNQIKSLTRTRDS